MPTARLVTPVILGCLVADCPLASFLFRQKPRHPAAPFASSRTSRPIVLRLSKERLPTECATVSAIG